MNINSKNKLPAESDVVVIGAGIAGLTAAALLAKAGLRVVTIEAQPTPGGYLAGFKRKGFTFDSSIQWLNQCHPGGLISNVFGYIDKEYPKAENAKRIHRYKGGSFDYLLTNDPDQFRDQLIKDFPEDAEGILKFFKFCKKTGKHFDIMKSCMRSMETMSPLEKITYGLKMLWWVLPVIKTLKMSAEDGLARFFKAEGIKKIFCSEKRFMSVIMPICWAYAGDFQFAPKGGAEVFVTWLCEKINTSGSNLVFNSRVEKVLVEEGKAVGVELADGQVVKSKYVVAASDVENLYEKMLPKGSVPAELLKRLKDAELYYSMVTLYIGLDMDAADLGIKEEVACLTLDDITKDDQTRGDPSTSSLIVQAPSVADRSLAPKGKSTLTIHCASWFDQNDHWKTGENFERGEAYKKFKQGFADIMIKRVEKDMKVNIKDHIEVMEIATPITFWRYTENRAGSIMGARPSTVNIKNKIAHYRTPVKNLYLGGHWAEYAGGMPIAVKAATNASLLILKEENKDKFKELKDVMDGRNKNKSK